MEKRPPIHRGGGGLFVRAKDNRDQHAGVWRMRARKWLPVLPPFVVGLLGSEAYASSDAYAAAWGEILVSLYYVPIVVAAITLGARAGLIVAIGAGAAHALAAVG